MCDLYSGNDGKSKNSRSKSQNVVKRESPTAETEYSGGPIDKSSPLVSHLPLQMLLYFDMFYFPCWWISAVFMLNVKFEFLPGYYQWLLVTGIVLLTVVEVLRVYLGYTGNLKEKVPELAAFWVVSLTFPVPVLLFFLTDEDALILPLERAVHSLFLCLVMAELVASFLALRTMTRKLLLLFHLRQLGRAERLSPVYGLTLPYHRGALAVTPVHHMYR
uniref:Transmembrane protein 17 n=1 Tax=Periophthalmus magnuspinnatus TaxID=409849 RepID=A0A3B4AL30_9GOBI